MDQRIGKRDSVDLAGRNSKGEIDPNLTFPLRRRNGIQRIWLD